MPGKEGDPGRTAADNRLFVNAVLFVLKTGIPWEDLPERYGKPKSVWKRFDRWCASGVWERVFRAIGEDDLEEELAEVHLDSSSIKAHPLSTDRTPETPCSVHAESDCHHHCRCGLRCRRHPLSRAAAEGPGLYQTEPDPQGQEAVRSKRLQTSKPNRKVLRTHQALPSCGNTLRKESRQLRRIHLARRTHYRNDPNLRTT